MFFELSELTNNQLGLTRKFSFSYFRENLFSFSRKFLMKIDVNSEYAKSVILTSYFNFLRRFLSIFLCLLYRSKQYSI
jgi:hypothetical protein